MLYQGIDGALNAIGKTGNLTPIDASRYRRLSFRVRRSAGTPDSLDRVSAFWFLNTSQAGGGLALWQAKGIYANAQHANMMPQAVQANAIYQIFRVDLDAPLQSSGTAWGGMIKGLKVRLGSSNSMTNAAIDLDWIRLTERGNAASIRRLQWSGLGGRVVLRATHQNSLDTIQIYPEGTSGAVDFADNSFFDWDYGYLPPGTWTITAQGSSASRTATLVIDAAPVVTVLDPDVEGGRDFATTVLGDAWDLTNVQDVQRNNAALHHITSATFDENGLLGVTRGGSYASGCAADTCPDPFVQFLDDGFGFGPAVIPAATYHRLSFTLDYDHDELMIGDALSPTWGGVARVAWAHSDGTGFTPFTITQDIVVIDGGPVRYSMDLATFTDATTLENPIASLWQGNIGTFRIDINESEAAAELPAVERQGRRRRRAERQRLLPDPLAHRRRDADRRRRQHRWWRRDDGVLLRHRSQPGDQDADRVGHRRGRRHLLLEPGGAPGRRLLRLRPGDRRHRQHAGPLLDRPGPRRGGDSRRDRQQQQRPRGCMGSEVRRVEPQRGRRRRRRRPTSSSTRPARTRASRTPGRCPRGRPASSPSAWRSPTPTRHRPRSTSRSSARRRARRSSGATRSCPTAAPRSTSTPSPA